MVNLRDSPAANHQVSPRFYHPHNLRLSRHARLRRNQPRFLAEFLLGNPRGYRAVNHQVAQLSNLLTSQTANLLDNQVVNLPTDLLVNLPDNQLAFQVVIRLDNRLGDLLQFHLNSQAANLQ